MLFTFHCSHCSAELEIDSTSAGAEVQCPTCRTPQTVPRKSVGAGTTIGGFRIERLLGKGGMGEVYLARQLSMDRSVALKILPVRLTEREDLIARFLNEVKVTARLDHPNIVTAFEAGHDSGVHFLAMAYVKGESLESRLQSKHVFPEADALRIVRQLAAALDYAWTEHRMLHRDIKPANVLMDQNGTPKLADMGLSKSPGSDTGMTMSGMVMGTPNYMSPEQAEGRADLDFRADMYSLGATLYHMLTGQMPFAGSSIMDVLRKQATENLPDPREINPAISGPCVDLLQIMLAKDRNERYADWKTLIGDIDCVLQSRPPTVGVPGAGRSVLIRRPAGQGSAKKMIIHKPAPAPAPAPRAEPAKPPPKPSAARWAIPAGIAALVAVGVIVGFLMHGQSKKRDAEVLARRAAAQEAERKAAQKKAEEEARKAGLAKPASEQAMQTVLAGLTTKAEDLSRQGQHAAAADVYSKYEGEFSRELAPRRMELEGKYRALAREAAARAAAAQPVVAPTNAVAAQPAPEATNVPEVAAAAPTPDTLSLPLAALADDILRQDFQSARAKLTALRPAPPGIASAFDRVAAMPAVILKGFQGGLGTEVEVGLVEGVKKLKIVKVSDFEVNAQQIIRSGGREVGFIDQAITAAELSLPERTKRLGTENTPERSVMHGLLALESSRGRDKARELFAASGEPVGALLVSRLDQLEKLKAQKEADAMSVRLAKAEGEYKKLLGELGFPEDLADADAAARLRWKEYSDKQLAVIRTRVAACRIQPKEGGATPHAEVLDIIAKLKADFPLYMKDVANLRRETAEKAFKKLEAANPGGKVRWTFSIEKDGLTVDLNGNPGLKDLSPLAGLPIRRFSISQASLANLEGLRGLPIVELTVVMMGNLQNLGVVQGMPISRLSITSCYGIRDIRTLKGLPLKSLFLGDTHASSSDLLAIQDLPLDYFGLNRDLELDNLSFLKGHKTLRRLFLRETIRIADLAPLADLRLEFLYLYNLYAVHDLSPLARLPLKELLLTQVGGGEGVNLASLKGLPLKSLWLYRTRVLDRSPLQAMKGLAVHDNAPDGIPQDR